MVVDWFRLDGQVGIVTGKSIEVDGGLQKPDLNLHLPEPLRGLNR